MHPMSQTCLWPTLTAPQRPLTDIQPPTLPMALPDRTPGTVADILNLSPGGFNQGLHSARRASHAFLE